MSKHSAGTRKLTRQNLCNAKRLYPDLSRQQLSILRDLTVNLHLSVLRSELLYFCGKWYVSHSGLLRIAHRRRCVGIDTTIEHATEVALGRWVFRATVHKSQSATLRRLRRRGSLERLSSGSGCRDASGRDPGRQSRSAQSLWHRHLLGRGDRLVAETGPSSRESKKLPPQPVNGRMGITAAPKSATASASSSASTSSMPTSPEHLGSLQPHPLTPGTLPRGQTTTIRIPHLPYIEPN